MIRHVVIASLAFFTATTSNADEELIRLGEELGRCYQMQALSYGLTSCLPPSELLPVFSSKCREQIDAAYSSLLSKAPDTAVAQGALKNALGKIEEDASATIIDTQIARRTCAPVAD